MKGELKDSLFKGMQVIVSYLYQNYSKNKSDKEKWKWSKIFPLRTGILMDAYKTGNCRTGEGSLFYMTHIRAQLIKGLTKLTLRYSFFRWFFHNTFNIYESICKKSIGIE